MSQRHVERHWVGGWGGYENSDYMGEQQRAAGGFVLGTQKSSTKRMEGKQYLCTPDLKSPGPQGKARKLRGGWGSNRQQPSVLGGPPICQK